MNGVSKHVLGLGLALLTVCGAKAQDARYSQYYSAPQRINPALIGVFDGSWRAGLNYRTQWGAVMGQAYNTYSGHADMRVKLFDSDYLGLGFSALSDRAGLPGYQATDVSVGASYIKRLSSGGRNARFYKGKGYGSYLVAGAQVGFVQRSVNWDRLSFSTQYNQGTNSYNLGQYSGETDNVRDSKLSPDLNAGLTWYATYGNRRSVYAGMGMFHLNRPDISLFNEPPRDSAGNRVGTAVERLYTRWTFHAGGEFLVGGRGSSLSLVPGMVAMFQGPSAEINGGLSLRYKAPRYDDFAFKVGLWTRVSKYLESGMRPDALIVLVGLEYQSIQFGVSYDATVSGLGSQINSRGSLEFSVIYIHPADDKRKQGCPSFNF